MSMRIYNRDQSASLGARNNRLAKMRVFQQHEDTRIIQRNDAERAKE